MTARPKPGGRRKALNEKLVAELRRLQDDLHTMTERFDIRVGAALNDIIARIDGDDSIDQPSRLATIRTAQAMLEAIESTKIKAKRARAKDLQRMEELVRLLGDVQG